MTVIQSAGRLEEAGKRTSWASGGVTALGLYGDYTHDYAAIFRTQPNVRICVSFLGRNVGQLGLKVFERLSDDERRHTPTTGLAKTLRNPNPWTTPYRLKDALVSDMATFDNAFWLKVKRDGGSGIALLRMPPQYVEEISGNPFMPIRYRMFGRSGLEYSADQVVHFRGYNPDNGAWGISPLETLRRILAEEEASGQYRENFWRNSARLSGVLQRPKEAPALSTEASGRLRQQFEALYTGAQNSGRTAILEEGTEFKEVSVTAKDAQYLETRKLTREECAAAFHIPPPMVAILDHATFSNIEQQHRMLYQDTLGPWLRMIEEEIMLQLAPEFEDSGDLYCEFNLQEKLKGSFEEQVAAGQAAVGAPYMTRNEYRSRHNLPPIPGGDEIVTPLNVLVGGQASPIDSAPKSGTKALKAPEVERRNRWVKRHEEVLGKFFARQESVIVARIGKSRKAVEDVFDDERWNRELQADLFALASATVSDFGSDVAERYGAEFDPDRAAAWLEENSRVAAESVNGTTKTELESAMGDGLEGVRALFSGLVAARVGQLAMSRVTTTANFGRREGAKQAGVKNKTWRVTNPKSRHPQMDGETVPMDQTFSNGGMWPGDPALGVDEVARCQCLLDF